MKQNSTTSFYNLVKLDPRPSDNYEQVKPVYILDKKLQGFVELVTVVFLLRNYKWPRYIFRIYASFRVEDKRK